MVEAYQLSGQSSTLVLQPAPTGPNKKTGRKEKKQPLEDGRSEADAIEIGLVGEMAIVYISTC
jgi:hypothetical protein